jgi:hypothetical protein
LEARAYAPISPNEIGALLNAPEGYAVFSVIAVGEAGAEETDDRPVRRAADVFIGETGSEMQE